MKEQYDFIKGPTQFGFRSWRKKLLSLAAYTESGLPELRESAA